MATMRKFFMYGKFNVTYNSESAHLLVEFIDKNE